METKREHIVFSWNNVLVIVSKRTMTMNTIKTARDEYSELIAQFPKNVYLLTVLDEEASLPPPAVRTALGEFLAAGAGQVIMSAIVHEGGSFRAAAVRAVSTSLAELAQLPYPHKVFATVTDAAVWIQSNSPIGKEWNAAALADAVAEARRRYP